MEKDAKMLVAAAQKLKASGIKATPKRQIILAYMMSTASHPTVEMIYQGLKQSEIRISLATVYNTMQVLQEKKLVSAVAADATGHMHYDYVKTPHYHVICVRCGKIEDILDDSYQKLEVKAQKASHYRILSSQYEVFGLCPNCLAKEN